MTMPVSSDKAAAEQAAGVRSICIRSETVKVIDICIVKLKSGTEETCKDWIVKETGSASLVFEPGYGDGIFVGLSFDEAHLAPRILSLLESRWPIRKNPL